MSQLTKTCRVCGKAKDLSEFVRNKHRLDNLSSNCRECIHNEYIQRNEYYKSYYLANRDKKIAYQREYYNTNKDIIKERSKHSRKAIHDEFKKNIEAQWEEGMNWENYKTYWGIERKVPMNINLNNIEEMFFSLGNLNFKPVKLNINNPIDNNEQSDADS